MSTPMLGTGPMRGYGPMLGVGPMLGRSPLSGPVSRRPTFALDFARDQYSTLSPALTVSSPTGGVMVPDYLGNYHKTLANEIPIRGGRRLYNLLDETDTLATQGVTVEDADYWLSFKGTGSVAVTGVATDSLAGTGADDRVSKKVTMGSAGTATFTVTGSVTEAYLYKSRPGQTTADPEYVSRGVLSSPYHGYGVDGLAWMRTDPEGNSLAGDSPGKLSVIDFSGQPDGANPVSVLAAQGWVTYGTPATVEILNEADLHIVCDTNSEGARFDPGFSIGTFFEVAYQRSGDPGNVFIQDATQVASYSVGTAIRVRYRVTGSTLRVYFRANNNAAGDSTFGSLSVREVYPVPCTGIADWPQVTNLQRYSNALASWSPTNRPNVTVTSDDTVLLGRSFSRCSPSAAGTAQRYVLDVDASVVSGTTYTAQAKIKADGANSLMQITFNATRFGTGQWAFIDLADGSISSETGGSATVSPLGDGVFLVTWTAVCTSTGTSGIAFVLCSEDTGTLAPATLMDGDDDLLIADVQINAGAVALPFVPTDATAVTADAISSDVDLATAGVSEREMTVVMEYTAELPAPSSTQRVFSLRTDADNRAVVFMSSTGGTPQLSVYVEDGNVVQWSQVVTADWEAGVLQRIAARFADNDGSLVENGAEIMSDASMTVPAATKLHLMGDPDAAGVVGSIAAVAIYEGA